MRYLLGAEDWELTGRRLQQNAAPLDYEAIAAAHDFTARLRRVDVWDRGQARIMENPPAMRVESAGDLAGAYPGFVPLEGLVTPQPIVNMERAHEVAEALREGTPVVTTAFPSPPYPLEVEVSSDRHRGCTVMSEDPNIVVSDIQWSQEKGFAVTVQFRKASPVLSIMDLGDRYVIRNGVHRCVGYALAGLAEVPALIVPVRSWPPSPGLFDESVVLGDHPPRVVEFLQEGRYIDVDWRVRTRMWRVVVDEFVVPWGGDQHDTR